METITRINGNGQPYTTDLPKITILTPHEWNDVALAHIKENTGLTLTRTAWGYTAQPIESKQIVALLLTYNFKTQYYNNASNHNELMLKSDHHIGFKVDSICFECCQHNNIYTNGLKPGDRLAC